MARNPVQSIVAVLTVFLFLVVINSSFIEWAFHPVQATPLDDPKPEFPRGNIPWRLLVDNTSVRNSIETAFNSVFPLRDFFVRSWNAFQVAVFGDHKKAVLGEDGWVVGKQFLSDELKLNRDVASRREYLKNRLKALDEALRQSGTDCFLVVAPLKIRLYADKFGWLPDALTRESELCALLREEQGGLERIHVVDVASLLAPHIGTEKLYHQGDQHWTVFSGNMVARDVLARMNAIGGTAVPVPGLVADDERKQSVWRFEYSLIQGKTIGQEPESRLRLDAKATEKSGLNSLEYGRYVNTRPTPSGKDDSLVVIGDSFFSFFMLRNYMADFFDTTTFYNINLVSTEKYLALACPTQRPPRYLLLEFFEAGNGKCLLQDAWWDNLLASLACR